MASPLGTKKINSLAGMIALYQVSGNFKTWVFVSISQILLLAHILKALNLQNQFKVSILSWTEKGHGEAKAAGVLLKEEGVELDIAFTSLLSRAIRTCWYSLEESGHMHIPVIKSWRLNERYFVAITISVSGTFEGFKLSRMRSLRNCIFLI